MDTNKDSLKPIERGEYKGYTYRQAHLIIGAAQMNYIRQLVTQGRIRIVAQVPVKPGSSVVRTLLNIDDVHTVRANFGRRQVNGTKTFLIHATAEDMVKIAEFARTQLSAKLDEVDVTEQRRQYQAKRAEKKARAAEVKAEPIAESKPEPKKPAKK